MSATEQGLSIAERLERLKPLAAARATANVKRLKNFNPQRNPKPSPPSARKTSKTKKPYFYNPANRD